MRQDGVEGARIFGTLADGGQGWLDRPCDGSTEHVECEVESITQQLDVGTPNLTVVYVITGDLEGVQLIVGRFPKTELAACQGGALPELGLGSVKGTDGNVDIWTTETFDPTEAVVGQSGPITIYAKPAGGDPAQATSPFPVTTEVVATLVYDAKTRSSSAGRHSAEPASFATQMSPLLFGIGRISPVAARSSLPSTATASA